MSKLMIGWTTVPTKEVGIEIANGLIKDKLAACVNVEGPITSLFNWNDELEQAEEYNLAVKFASGNEEKIEKWIKRHHPYELPQWCCVVVSHTSQEYLKWATKTGLK